MKKHFFWQTRLPFCCGKKGKKYKQYNKIYPFLYFWTKKYTCYKKYKIHFSELSSPYLPARIGYLRGSPARHLDRISSRIQTRINQN